jgi:hypothetical protein
MPLSEGTWSGRMQHTSPKQLGWNNFHAASFHIIADIFSRASGITHCHSKSRRNFWLEITCYMIGSIYNVYLLYPQCPSMPRNTATMYHGKTCNSMYTSDFSSKNWFLVVFAKEHAWILNSSNYFWFLVWHLPCLSTQCENKNACGYVRVTLSKIKDYRHKENLCTFI